MTWRMTKHGVSAEGYAVEPGKRGEGSLTSGVASSTRRRASSRCCCLCSSTSASSPLTWASAGSTSKLPNNPMH